MNLRTNNNINNNVNNNNNNNPIDNIKSFIFNKIKKIKFTLEKKYQEKQLVVY